MFYPALLKECFLAVNISSIDSFIQYDATCILKTGDHPFVKHDSYVYYRKADIFGATTTARLVAEGEISSHDPFSDVVFEKILDGFYQSKEVRPKVLKYFQKYCS